MNVNLGVPVSALTSQELRELARRACARQAVTWIDHDTKVLLYSASVALSRSADALERVADERDAAQAASSEPEACVRRDTDQRSAHDAGDGRADSVSHAESGSLGAEALPPDVQADAALVFEAITYAPSETGFGESRRWFASDAYAAFSRLVALASRPEREQ